MSTKRSLWNVPKSEKYSDEWYTPPALVKSLGTFDLDPSAAPPPYPRHAKTNWTKKQGGLDRDWFGRVWLNPPYSTLPVWIEKMIAHRNGIILVNAWPERHWFCRAAAAASAVLFITGRPIQFWRADKKRHESGCVGQALIAYGAKNAEAIRSAGVRGLFCSNLKRQ